MSLKDIKNSLSNIFKKENHTNQVPVIMENGTIEYYDPHFIITDGENCVICNSAFYHTSLDCENLLYEGNQFKAKRIKDAKKEKMTYCANCSRQNYLYKHGRFDEI